MTFTVKHFSYTETRCVACNGLLESAEDWSAHKRLHTLEYWNSTPDGRQMLEMLRGMGLKDEPDRERG